MVLDLDCRLKKGGDHVATSIGSETAMMSVSRGRYYAVGRSAERIWQLLDQPITPREIIDHLQQEYEVGPERCRRDVVAFLEDLMAEELIEVRAP